MFVDMVVNSCWVLIDFRSLHLFGPAWTPSPWWCFGWLMELGRLLNTGCHPQLQNLLLLLSYCRLYENIASQILKNYLSNKNTDFKALKPHNHLFRFPRFYFFHQKPRLGVPTSGHVKAWPVIASVARHLPRRDEVPWLLLDHACLYDGAHGCRSEGTPCILGCLLDFVICWVVLWLMANKYRGTGHLMAMFDPYWRRERFCQVGDVIVTLLKALY